MIHDSILEIQGVPLAVLYSRIGLYYVGYSDTSAALFSCIYDTCARDLHPLILYCYSVAQKPRNATHVL